MPDLLLDRLASIRAAATYDPDTVYGQFVEWATARGLTLYSAQDEALIEIVSGANLILSTPTGTGKSLVAIAAHNAIALIEFRG